MKTLTWGWTAALVAALAVGTGRADDAALLARAQPRVMTARRVASFDALKTLAWFRANAADFAEREQFCLCECGARPSTEICWDVCRDAQDILHISLYYYDLGPGEGAGDRNSIEIVFAPYGELGPGHLQCGVTGVSDWTSDYWPYRDGRPNLARAFASGRSVSSFATPVGETTERMVTFHVPVAAVAAPETKGLVGFNMMRCNLTAGENATWNMTCGAAFPDASGCGWLRLSDDAPMPRPVPRAKPLAGKPQLQVEYDWPDEMVGGPYTREALKAEFSFLKRHNVGRLYWIDYPDMDAKLRGDKASGSFDHIGRIFEHESKTYRNFGNEDPMFVACRLAHELGLEFYVTVKPYDLAGNNAFCEANGAKYGFRRNPKWTDPQGPKTVKKLTLYAAGDRPLPFDPSAVKVLTSPDNKTYEPVTGFNVATRSVELPNVEWTPAGNRPVGGTHKATALEFTDIPGPTGFVAFEFPEGDWSFSAPRYELVSIETDAGKVRGMCTRRRSGKPGFLAKATEDVYDFLASGGCAGWSDATEGIDGEYGFAGGGTLCVALSETAVRPDMLEPSFPEVRRYWIDHFIRRAIAAGVDGVDVRIANHHEAPDWLAYGYAEPVLAAFRAKYGRDPECTNADFEAVRRLRGAAHTQFLREAGALLHQAGKKLEHHVEARMKASPAFDAYEGIHYDWATWIDEGVVDGVNLKYLGPLNRFVETEIMPRAQKRGIPVNQIAAYGDPRRQARTAEENAFGMAYCRLGGVNAFNLYETWCYLRTLPGGERMVRGNALMVFERLKPLAREVR